VRSKKNILIITDGSGEIALIAAIIRDVITSGGDKVVLRSAQEFAGNDILPADAFFLGCEAPKPKSFEYLEDLLKHINLAGRLCGIFTNSSDKAIKYLSNLVKDSEVALYPAPLIGVDSTGGNTKKWTEKVLSGTFLIKP